MKLELKTKKRIAKEILILFGSMVVLFILVGSLFFVYELKINDVSSEEIDEKLNEKESVENGEWSTKREEIREKALKKLKRESSSIIAKQSLLKHERDYYAKSTIIFLLALVYPVRIIVLLLRWSIRTLRN